MTTAPDLHDVTISTDGEVFVDGEKVPFLISDEIVTTRIAGLLMVNIGVLAGSVTYAGEPPKPEMTQADAHDIFRRRNPNAFKEPSA